MSIRAWRLLALSILCAVPAWTTAPRPALAAAPAAEPSARVIVKYKALGALMRRTLAAPGGSAAPAAAPQGPQHAAVMGARLSVALADGRIIDRHSQVLQTRSGISSKQLAALLSADPDVEYAVPDQRRRIAAVPTDPLFAGSASTSPAVGQWYLRGPDGNAPSAINATAAWDLTRGAASTVVAVLDTGVLFDHPDLQGKLLAGYDFIQDAAVAGDGSARDGDPTDPGDWVSAGECGIGERAENSSWHGTEVASLIAAGTNNGIGMAGIGWDLRVLPVRVLGKCGGYDSDIIAGMLWAGGLSAIPVANPNPARVLNMSLGADGACSAAYQDAVNRLTAARVVVVVSAGNSEGLAVGSPANCNGVIAVTGLRHVGTKVGFSSIGPEVALAAPGGNCVNTTGPCLYPIITATNAGTRTATQHTWSDSSHPSLGTSYTAPLVAGTAALMLSANPNLTPGEVRNLLQRTARPFPTTSSDSTVAQCRPPSALVQDECLCTSSTCGAGMLDAGAAVAAAAVGQMPVVRIAAASTVATAGALLGFDGSASTVAGGRSVARWAWAVTGGQAIAAINGAANQPVVQVATRGTGSFTLTLTLTDSNGSSASASTVVNVQAPAAPVVDVQTSASAVGAGATVSFDGGASVVAPGLTVAAYHWSISSGAGLASLTSPATGSTATVATSGAGAGSFTVTLTVTDSLGQQASASRTVTVTAVAPLASFTASALTVAAGERVRFDAASSSAPAGRTLTAYQWALTSDGSAALSGATNGAATTVDTTRAGSFTVTLTVTDSAGAQASRSTTVQVTPPAASAGGGGGGGGSAGSGGGGAMSGAWVAALALAAALLARRPRRTAARRR